jgi:hypothetical protein
MKNAREFKMHEEGKIKNDTKVGCRQQAGGYAVSKKDWAKGKTEPGRLVKRVRVN